MATALDAQVPDRGPAVFAVTTATLVLASVFVGARIVCRHFIVRNVSWDDKIMALAWVFAFFLSFTIDLAAVNGLGKKDADIPGDDWGTLRHCEYVFSILYNPALMGTKTSILIFYLRLAKNTQIVLRYASWVTLAVVNLSGLVLTFMNIFQCTPIQAAWAADFHGPSTCIPLLTEFICAAPVNILTDLAILALPIPVLTGMRLPSRQKTILVITFALGIFVTIVDVVRIYYLQRAITDVPTGTTSDPESRFGGEADFAWNASLSLMWSAVEVNVGMACACIPTLKPLILKLLPAMLHDPNGTRTSSMSRGPMDPDMLRRGSMATGGAVAIKADEAFLADGDVPIKPVDFLTIPETAVIVGSSSRHASSDTATHAPTSFTASSAPENGVFFGFVNMAKPKSMLRAGTAESLKYCTIVSILFFLWGLSYGLLNTLNNAVAAVNHMRTSQTLGLTSAYFGGGYFFGPLLVGEWILRRDEHNRTKRHEKNEAEHVGGFKATFIVGLCIYGIGTIIFWPSAVTNSYGGFMLSNFVVGFGLSVLEVGANSFMVLCGPAEYGETRLLVAQGIQGVGSVLSGLLAQKVFFKGISQDNMPNSMTLINVQWTYLGITLLCVILGLFFYYMPLPEVSDKELKRSASLLPSVDPKRRSIGGLELRTVSLILAVFTQWVYVASQESNSIFFRGLLISIFPSQDARPKSEHVETPDRKYNPDRPPGISLPIPDYLLVGHSAFAVSRFLVGYLTYLSVSRPRLPQPRTYLSICVAICFICALLLVTVRPAKPDLLVIPVLFFFFAEGPIWPLIFALGLRGQGRRTKRAAAFITMGGSGPAFFPFIMYSIARYGNVQRAYIVIMALQVAMMAYPAFLEVSRAARRLVDQRPDLRHGLPSDDTPLHEIIARREAHTDVCDGQPSPGFLRRMSKGLDFGFGGAHKGSHPGGADHSADVSPRTSTADAARPV
ncbi:hypothetical protein CDD81_2589 [Ophiocordyceps australis]|uniref:Rhodopsin domain-containing protein n=1 Tax=Ophiocordyceps australis TaxID=1399860 RepID=A0A2C5XR82_9HYPO|nr:hypothetical protein CDD81_2589 [Ophiocordyceps australis]